MTRVDLLGYLASGLVLGTFCMKTIVPLRLMAIGSNIAFILYGCFAAIEPVLLLHAVLLPLNLWRLAENITASGARNIVDTVVERLRMRRLDERIRPRRC